MSNWFLVNIIIICSIYLFLTENFMSQIVGLNSASMICSALKAFFRIKSKNCATSTSTSTPTSKIKEKNGGLKMELYLSKVKCDLDNVRTTTFIKAKAYMFLHHLSSNQAFPKNSNSQNFMFLTDNLVTLKGSIFEEDHLCWSHMI